VKPIQVLLKRVFANIPPKRLVVLGYHRVRPERRPGSDAVATLKAQLDLLRTLGYRFLTVREAVQGVSSKNRVAVLTFDDGYQDFYYVVAPLLRQYEAKATVFVVSGYVDTDRIFEWVDQPETPLDWVLTSQQIIELHREGFEIGSHTVSHPRLTDVHMDRIQHELVDSKRMLEEIIGDEVASFCYPQGFYNRETMRLVREAGYRAAVVSRFSTGVTHPWVPRNTAYDLARIYPYSDLSGFRRQLGVGYELFQYASYFWRTFVRKR